MDDILEHHALTCQLAVVGYMNLADSPTPVLAGDFVTDPNPCLFGPAVNIMNFGLRHRERNNHTINAIGPWKPKKPHPTGPTVLSEMNEMLELYTRKFGELNIG